MSCCTNGCSDCDCRVVMVVGGLPLVLLGVAGYLLFRLVTSVDLSLPLPDAAWIPLSILAGGAAIFGLWLGFTVHRHGGLLFVGLFGVVVAALGLAVSSPLALLGVLIVLGAAAYSAILLARHRTEA